MRALPRLRLALAALSVCAALAACTSGTPKANPSASPSALSQAQILAIARQYTRCMHEHGVPEWNDPIFHDGRVDFPEPSGGGVKDERTIAAANQCRHLMDALPRNAFGDPQYTQEDLANLVKYAQCIRANGVPEWPDPKADGSFPVNGTPLEQKSDRLYNALEKCRQYWNREIRTS